MLILNKGCERLWCYRRTNLLSGDSLALMYGESGGRRGHLLHHHSGQWVFPHAFVEKSMAQRLIHNNLSYQMKAPPGVNVITKINSQSPGYEVGVYFAPTLFPLEAVRLRVGRVCYYSFSINSSAGSEMFSSSSHIPL